MTPRAYDMSRRADARELTRRRIIDATLELHGEKGVFGTSWQDIAREADVSVTTVYAHFPSLQELVPACGDVLMARIRPPQPDQAPAIIGDARESGDRLERVAQELFAFYERGGPHLEIDLRERRLPALQEWETSLLNTVAALVREALAEEQPDATTIQMVSAFLDLPTFTALRRRGLTGEQAARTVAQLAVCLLRQKRQRQTD